MKTQLNIPPHQGKQNSGCLQFAVLIIFMVLAAAANAQDKPKPSVRLEQPEVVAILNQIDTVSAIVQRSDMAKQERNNSADRLQSIRQFLITKFEQQNAVKQDTVKVKSK